jgi:xylan 1,4-beta-xylosidase
MMISRRELLKKVVVAGAYFGAASVLDGCRGVGVFDALSRSLSATHFTADVSEVVSPCEVRLWGNIAFDPMYSATVAPEARQAWDMIRASKAFRYVRCHNTFSDAPPGATPEEVMGCRVYTEDRAGRPQFNFEYLDQVLDIWTGAGLKPILEMDFMPDALAEGDIIRNYGGGAINPPRDLNKWRALIYETVAHLIQRYGRNEVRTWYFEIWNEPDLKTYWIDGAQDEVLSPTFDHERMVRFLRMYDYFVDGTLAADPEIKVGGPGLAHHEDFFKLFLDHITNGTNTATGRHGTRADFISWHAYGSSTEVLAKNWARARMVRSYPELAKVELHHTEWGQELLPEDDRPNVRVSGEYDAAFLCRGLDNVFTHTVARVDLFARWGDLINGWRPLFRQYGTQLVPLPIFHAYALLAKLGPERIAVDGMWPGTPVRSFATRRGHAQAQIVLYYFDEANQHSVGEVLDVNLTVRGLAGATVPLTVSRVDRDHANVYRAWVAMGSPASPTAAQAVELAARAKVTAETRVVRVEGGEANLSLGLPPNGLALVLVGQAEDE